MTTQRSPFRSHDAAPPFRSAPALLHQLAAEWTALHHSPSSQQRLQEWGHTDAPLAGLDRPGDLVDRIDQSLTEEGDEILVALLQLHQNGDNLAGRILLQVMLPALTGLTRRCRMPRDVDTHAARLQLTITTFWSVISQQKATHRVASRLSLDTLNQLTRHQRWPTDTWEHHTDHMDTADTPAPGHTGEPRAAGELSEHPDLAELLIWAVSTNVLTRDDAQLLADIYSASKTNHAVAARNADISLHACHKRSQRARQRLIAAVRANSPAGTAPGIAS